MKADILAITPFLFLALGSLFVLIADLFTKSSVAKFLTIIFSFLALLCSLMHLCPTCYGIVKETAFFETIYTGKLSYIFSALISLGTLLTALFTSASVEEAGIDSPSEYYTLLLMSSAGAIIFANSAEFITLFLGLETMSMGLYCLCASSVKRRTSSESGLKYFLLGSFSSAFLLYGIVLIYGLTGSTFFSQITEVLSLINSGSEYAILSAGIGLIILGLVFKIGLVPFHFWAPDVYQGAPTPITAYMSVVIKIAAVGISSRIFFDVFAANFEIWEPALWFIAAVTLLFANVVALRQRSLKRMLAYSSIGHAGYIAMAFLAKDTGGLEAIIYYLVAYTLMTIGAFAVVFIITSKSDDELNADDISNLNGLSTNNPLIAALMTLFMLALAGLPPGMSGMIGKFYIFNAALKSNYIGLSVIAVLSATVACYYYLRVIVAMYFVKTDEEVAKIDVPCSLNFVCVLCAALIIIFGICPSIVSY